MDKLTVKITTQLAPVRYKYYARYFHAKLEPVLFKYLFGDLGLGGAPQVNTFTGHFIDASILWLSSILYIFFVPPSLFLESCEVTDWWAYQNPLNISETIWEGDCFCGHCTVAHLHSGGTLGEQLERRKNDGGRTQSGYFRHPGGVDSSSEGDLLLLFSLKLHLWPWITVLGQAEHVVH